MVMEEQENAAGLASESIPVPHVQDTGLAPVQPDITHNEGTRGKPRHRKKVLHSMILKQMEFYFGDANLSKDRFLRNLVEIDPWIDLNVFLQFNKIRALTHDPNRIAKALKNSTILEISEDGNKVRRLTAIKPRENCEACSVYVQGLPPDADHDWLINIFSRYGAVDYVSIPKYKTNKKIKGFAFIEFKNAEDAQKCLKAFEDKDCTLPLHTSPHELLSITTFSEDDPPTGIDNTTLGLKPIAQDVQSKRKCLDNSEYESVSKAKKAKIRESEKESEDLKNGDEKIDIKDEDYENCEDDKDGDIKKKKRKRKRRARAEQPDIIDFGLRIMAKRDWKKLRNKYLELQREKMKQLKQHFRKTRWNQYSHEKKEIKVEIDDKDNKDEKMKNSPKFTFSEGLIVKIELDEPCTNPKSFKNQFRTQSGVQYIDIRESSNIAYIRCDTQENTKQFYEKYSEDKALSILSGDEEKSYWDKMLRDRDEKLTKKDRPKQRGRDKLLKKAEKELGKHIKFDEV